MPCPMFDVVGNQGTDTLLWFNSDGMGSWLKVWGSLLGLLLRGTYDYHSTLRDHTGKSTIVNGLCTLYVYKWMGTVPDSRP